MSSPEVFHVPASPTREQVFERVAKLFARLPMDKAYRIEVSQHRPRRSNSQNAYLWGAVYPHILKAGAEHLGGWEAEDLHEYLLGEHFGWERVEAFNRVRMRPIRRSSKLNKQEFSDFVEFIKRRMAGFSIVIPDAGEGLEGDDW